MAISIATTFQLKTLARGEDSTTWSLNVPSGNLQMACIGHERDSTINSVAWNGSAMTKWAGYANPTSGWQAISVYALKGFTQGTKNFTFSQTGMYGYTYLMVMSWSGVDTYKSVDQTGHESELGSNYWYTQNITTNLNDVAIMLVRSADGGLAYHSDRNFCVMGWSGNCAVQGLYTQATSGSSTAISQQGTSDSMTRHVDCLTLAMSPEVVYPPSTVAKKMLEPIWFT